MDKAWNRIKKIADPFRSEVQSAARADEVNENYGKRNEIVGVPREYML